MMKPQTHQPREQSRGGGGRNKKSGHNEQQQQPVKLIVKRSYSTDTSINTAASTTTSNVASVVVPPPMGGSTGGGLVLAKRPSPSSQQRPSVVRYYLFIKRVVYLSLTRLSRFFFSSFPSFFTLLQKNARHLWFCRIQTSLLPLWHHLILQREPYRQHHRQSLACSTLQIPLCLFSLVQNVHPRKRFPGAICANL